MTDLSESHPASPTPPQDALTPASQGNPPAVGAEAVKPLPNPFVGPRSFEPGEQIFGRDLETYQLANLLSAERIVLFYSPSGAGKTSLIHAALIPELHARHYSVRSVARVNREPEKLPAGLPESYNRYIYSVLSWLESDLPEKDQIPEAELVGMRLADYLARRPRPADINFEVFIFDQFEEILTLDATDQAAKQGFFDQVGEALSDRSRLGLFSMREDFKAALDPYVLPVPTRFSATFRLELLGVEAARQAMQGPAQSQGVTFTKQAADNLIDDLRLVQVQNTDGTFREQLGPFVEPVQLQVVCVRLWESLPAGSTTIDTQHLTGIKNVGQALADYYAQRVADAAVKTGVSERLIRRWFQSDLITESGVRGQVLMGPNASHGLGNRAIRLLEDAHLVRSEKRGNSTWFELSHDRLIDPVLDNNQDWFAHNLSLLQRQAALWSDEDRPDGLLVVGGDLIEIQKWANAHASDLMPAETDFLAASHKAQKAANRDLRNNRIMVVLAVLITLAAIGALLALRRSVSDRSKALSSYNAQATSAQQAIEAKKTADQASLLAVSDRNAAQTASAQEAVQRATAVAASTLAVMQKDLADAASSQALDQKKTAEAASTEAVQQRDLAQQEHQNYISRQFAYSSDQALTNNPDLGLLLAVEAISVTDTIEAQTSLFKGLSAEHPLAYLKGNTQSIKDVALSPDNQWVASASADGSFLWPVSAPSYVVTPITYTAAAARVAFSPDGKYLATLYCYNSEITLHDISDPEHPKYLKYISNSGGGDACSDANLGALVFSPDNHTLAASLNTSKVFLWDITAGQAVTLTGAASTVTRLAFTPDGAELISGENSGGVHLWQVAKAALAQPLLETSPLTNTVTALTVITEADVKALFVVDATGMAEIWDLTQNKIMETAATTGQKNLVALLFDPTLSTGFIVVLDGNTVKAGVDIDNLHQFAGSSAPVTAVAISSDTSLLVSGSSDSQVIVWRTNSSNAISGAPLTADSSILSLAYTQNGSLQTLVGGGPGFAYQWSTASRRLTAHQALPITVTVPISATPGSLAFLPDGKLLASGEQDTAFIWDLVAGKHVEIHNPKLPKDAPSKVITSPDGQKIAMSYSGDAWVWDITASQPTTVTYGSDYIYDLAFSPDGQALAYTTYYTVTLWNLVTGEKDNRIKSSDSYSLAFSPDGSVLAIGGYYQGISLWNVQQSELITTFTSITATGSQKLLFSPDGAALASIASDGSVALWEVPQGVMLHIPNPSHARVASLAFSPHAPVLVVGYNDGTMNLWDLSTNPPVPQPLVGHTDALTGLAFSPDGQTLASASLDKTIRLWDLGSYTQIGEPLVELRQTSIAPTASSLAVSLDGKRMAVGSAGQGVITLYDLSTRLPVTHTLLSHQGSVNAVVFSPDGRWLASGGADGKLILWDAASGERIRVLKNVPNAAVTAICFSADNRLLAAAIGNDIVRLDLNTFNAVGNALGGHKSPVIGLAFSPDGSQLASQESSGPIFVWDTAASRLLHQIENPLSYSSNSFYNVLAFSPDGKMLVSGLSSERYAISLWDAAGGKPLGSLAGHKNAITSLAFSPDGSLLASSASDNTIYFWQVSLPAWRSLACQVVGRNLSWEEWNQYLSDSGQTYRPTCPDNPIDYAGIAAGYSGKIRDLISTRDAAQAQDVLKRVIKWIVSLGKSDPAATFCQLDIPPGFVPLLAPACRLAAQASTDSLQSARFSIKVGDSELARQALQRAAQQVDADPVYQRAAAICSLGYANHFSQEVAPACQAAAQLAPDNAGRMEFFAQGGETLKAKLALDSGVTNALAKHDAGAMQSLCTQGVRYHLQPATQKACLSAAKDATDAVHKADFYSLGGDLTQARTEFAQAVKDAGDTDDLSDDYLVCKLGSLDGFAGQVIDACKNAVKAATNKNLASYQAQPMNPAYYQEMLGLAEALMAQPVQAAADFQAYLDWFKAEGYTAYDIDTRERMAAELQTWIAVLTAGGNPFDADTIMAIRNE